MKEKKLDGNAGSPVVVDFAGCDKQDSSIRTHITRTSKAW